ncbi:hypothetical protein [Knoellia aerolata]|nr:hypothetical protein [Knoellia aerolata]
MRLSERFGALAGALAILLVIIGSDVLGTPPGAQTPHPSGQQSLDRLQWVAETSSAQVGVSVELLGFAFLVLFIAHLSVRVGGAGWIATAALAGGVIAVALKLASGAPMFVAYLLRDEISPQTARLLSDLNGVAFVMMWLPMGIFVACASAAGLLTRELGRVLGWFGIVAGSACVLATVVTGLHVLSAFFLPYVLCLLWILLVSLRLGLRRALSVAATTQTRVPVEV